MANDRLRRSSTDRGPGPVDPLQVDINVQTKSDDSINACNCSMWIRSGIWFGLQYSERFYPVVPLELPRMLRALSTQLELHNVDVLTALFSKRQPIGYEKEEEEHLLPDCRKVLNSTRHAGTQYLHNYISRDDSKF